MRYERPSKKTIILIGLLSCALFLLGYMYRIQLNDIVTRYYQFLTDREQVKLFIISFGNAAPVIFILLQILQVIFAPIPGEVSGFIGGYIFGAVPGFIFSSIGLGIGSGINFLIGRILGKKIIWKWIPERYLNKFDKIVREKGIFVIFLLFVFPGFPKDYFCIFLGFSSISVRALVLIAAVGRMPGTLMLSFQGALLFDKNYFVVSIMLVVCLFIAFLSYRYRNKMTRWLEKYNGNRVNKSKKYGNNSIK